MILGPFLTRVSEPGEVIDGFQATGWQIECASPEEVMNMPIVRHFRSWRPTEPELSDYMVREADLPCDTPRWSHQQSLWCNECLVEIGPVLAALYAQTPDLRPATDVLAELRDCLPLFGHSWREFGSWLLDREGHAAGFRILDVHPYGRRLLVEIGWLFPQDRQAEAPQAWLWVCGIEFRPKPDGTLNAGKWQLPGESHEGSLLYPSLRTMAPSDPVTILPEATQRRLLGAFEWTPLVRMTGAEARRARVEFVRSHAELIETPKDLATALKGAGLYSPDTTLHQIVKFLPSLVQEAGGGGMSECPSNPDAQSQRSGARANPKRGSKP